MPAVGPDPAVQTAAVSVASVTAALVGAVTGQGAARPIAVGGTVKVAAGASPPWGTEALSTRGFTRCTTLTVTRLSTVISVPALLTLFLTAVSVVTGRAQAVASHRVTGHTVPTVTEVLAV